MGSPRLHSFVMKLLIVRAWSISDRKVLRKANQNLQSKLNFYYKGFVPHTSRFYSSKLVLPGEHSRRPMEIMDNVNLIPTVIPF